MDAIFNADAIFSGKNTRLIVTPGSNKGCFIELVSEGNTVLTWWYTTLKSESKEIRETLKKMQTLFKINPTEKSYEITYDLPGGGARMEMRQSRDEAEKLAEGKRQAGILYKFIEVECDGNGRIVNSTNIHGA